MNILAKILEFVKELSHWAKLNINTLILLTVVILFVLLSFACGYIIAKYQDRAPVIINQSQ